MTTRIIRTPEDLAGWIRLLSARPLPMTVSAIKGASRTAQQNRLMHKWFSQIGAELGMLDIEVKAECKARYGLPIMKRDNPEWVDEWEPLYLPLPYPMKLKMFEIIPMTSLFTSKQMSEFMDAVQVNYRLLGIALIDPEARKYDADFDQ